MTTSPEKAAFSQRLLGAMKRAPENLRGATDLAHGFNQRHHGEGVSPQTAHKWISGRTIPRLDKLEVLARWFDVDLHWLRYGGSEQSKEIGVLMARIAMLTARQRALVGELVAQLCGEAEGC